METYRQPNYWDDWRPEAVDTFSRLLSDILELLKQTEQGKQTEGINKFETITWLEHDLAGAMEPFQLEHIREGVHGLMYDMAGDFEETAKFRIFYGY